jgi:hypothetical protein
MKSKNRVWVGAAVVAVAVASVGGVAFAQQPEAAADLTMIQVVQKLESMGYTNIHDVEKDDRAWEVEATAPNGTRVELELDLKDGRIVHEANDDDRD